MAGHSQAVPQWCRNGTMAAPMGWLERTWKGGRKGLAEAPGPLAQLYTARYPLIAAAAALALTSIVWSVPVLFSLAAFLLIAVLTTLMPGRYHVVRRLAAERREARAAPDASMRAMADALARPAFLLDSRGGVRHANAAARSQFAATRAGDPLALTFRLPQLGEALRQAASGRTATLQYRERGEADRVYTITLTPILRNGGQPLVLAQLDEITEQLAVGRMRADFVANASHELRTPLASLTGFIETLLGAARDDAEARERFLKMMLEQATRMRRLVDDLLSLSLLEMRAHQRPEGSVDVVEAVRQVVDSLQPLAAELKMEVEVDAPEPGLKVRGNRDELIQVFENLIENGLKYGEGGGRLEVAVERAATGPAPLARVSVRDYGPGIPPEHLPRLTERFFRVDVATSREKQGTGLGLAIAKHILTRHRGRLDIWSRPGEGSRFSVELPLTEAGGQLGVEGGETKAAGRH
jgi:two-component system phosphate regulon sensor histidine kinase PhoR